MEMPKPTEADRARFTSLVPVDPRVVVKPMFGNLGAFVNGNMFMGLFGADVGVKLPADQLAKLVAAPGAGPFGPAERPMGGYATLPAAMSRRSALNWTSKALAHVADFPPKVAKTKSSKSSK
jgi:TfoX/Sxy family transcriptional regulator of competence genes